MELFSKPEPTALLFLSSMSSDMAEFTNGSNVQPAFESNGSSIPKLLAERR